VLLLAFRRLSPAACRIKFPGRSPSVDFSRGLRDSPSELVGPGVGQCAPTMVLGPKGHALRGSDGPGRQVSNARAGGRPRSPRRGYSPRHPGALSLDRRWSAFHGGALLGYGSRRPRVCAFGREPVGEATSRSAPKGSVVVDGTVFSPGPAKTGMGSSITPSGHPTASSTSPGAPLQTFCEGPEHPDPLRQTSCDGNPTAR